MKYKCKIDSCLKKRTAQGLCQAHYDIMRSKTSKRKYAQLLKRCKDSNRETNLTEDLLFSISSGVCSYCGQTNNSTGHGLDRIDSSKDYLIGNVVSCCALCNKQKSDTDVKDFINNIMKIYHFQKYKIDRLYDLADRD
jgi:5-methylcytosine-specific restriction endonuclease McrA